MAWFVKLDQHEDLDVLANFVNARLARFNENISAYVEHAIQYERIAEALAGARQADAVVLQHHQPAPKDKKKEPVLQPKMCPTHPSYGAKRRPRTACETCWAMYEKYNGHSATVLARRKFNQKGGHVG